MWPFNDRTKSRAARPYSFYLHGRRRACGLLGDAEAARFLAEDKPLGQRVAFVLGCLAPEGEALPSESEVELLVKTRLGFTPPSQKGVGEVVVRLGGGRGGDDGGGSAPAAAQAARWIGDPLPAGGA